MWKDFFYSVEEIFFFSPLTCLTNGWRWKAGEALDAVDRLLVLLLLLQLRHSSSVSWLSWCSVIQQRTCDPSMLLFSITSFLFFFCSLNYVIHHQYTSWLRGRRWEAKVQCDSTTCDPSMLLFSITSFLFFFNILWLRKCISPFSLWFSVTKQLKSSSEQLKSLQ